MTAALQGRRFHCSSRRIEGYTARVRRTSEAVLVTLLLLIAAAAQSGAPALLVSGDNAVVQFPVIHHHGISDCYGYLYFSKDSIRYEVVRPEKKKDHAFEYKRADVLVAREASNWVGQHFMRIEFRDGKPHEFFAIYPSGLQRSGDVKGSDMLPPQDLLAAANDLPTLVSRLERSQVRAAETSVPAHPPDVQDPLVRNLAVARVGMLRVVSRPAAAQVYLDNEFRGTTSEREGELVVKGIPPGTYRLRLTVLGYKDFEQQVTLTPESVQTIEAALTAAGPIPLELKEVEDALKNGVPRSRIMGFVRQYGVDFTLTDEVEQRLRNLGADSDLLLAITKSKK